MASDTPAAGATPFRAKGPSYIATIAIGHGIKHWYLAAFAVFLPLIEKEYALTTGGVALLVTLRQVAGSAPNFFIGYVTDRLRDHWNLLLPASLFACAAGMMLAGLAPWYWMLVASIAVSTGSASFWHPPAISMLSTRFPTRKGMAIAFHGSGSGAGEALAPLGVGFLLAMLLADDWKLYVVLAMIPAVGFTALVYWMLSGAGELVHPERTAPPKLTDVFMLLRYPTLRRLAFVNFIRSFAHFGLLSFLPIYLARDLDMDSFGVGFHVALLTLLGVGLGPLLGHYSDRVGRRGPLLIALMVIGLGMVAMGILGSGIGLTIALAITGLFLWSMQDITNAAAMDGAPPGAQGSVVGMMFSSSLIAGAISPAVMATAISLAGERSVIFFVAGASVIPAIVVLALSSMPRVTAKS
jgi:FSR family fosmidomycin resistance protein-like MFS transporter